MSVRDAALGYLARGWFVLPVWGVAGEDGALHCACPAGPNCNQGHGKHPLGALAPRGLLDATNDPDVVDSWFEEFPDASVGLPLRMNGLMAFDVDEYRGDADRFAELETRLGMIPPTLTQLSGSGRGYHLFFEHPGFDLRGNLDGITVRSRNYVVAAPSRHVSGGAYSWPAELPVAELPDAWKEALERPEREGSRRPPFTRDGTWPLERRMEAVRAFLDDCAPAIEGEMSGDTNMTGGTYTFWVAQQVVRGYHLDPETACDLLLENWNHRCQPEWEPQDLLRKCVQAEREGELIEWGEHLRHEQETLDTLREVLEAAINARDGGEDDPDPRHAIVYASGYRVWDYTERRYLAPATRKDHLISITRDAWAQSPPNVSTWYEDGRGRMRPMGAQQVFDRYGVHAEKYEGGPHIDRAHYDAQTNTFYEPLCQIRSDLEPEYNEGITEWLTLLFGEEHVGRVLDWLASVPELSHPTCALYINAPSQSGKGLLARGIGRLWPRRTPVEFERVVGTSFNDDLLQSPFIWLDEGIPDRSGNLTSEIRSLVSARSITISKKHVDNREVHISPRLIVCANNVNVLSNRYQDLDVQDLVAIARRFLYIRCGDASVEWLARRKPWLTNWVEGDGIAKYVLWQHQNREYRRGSSFLVEGHVSEMHRALMIGTGVNSLVLEWVARFVSDPEPLYKWYATRKQQPKADIIDGEILVNTQALIDCWDMYIKSDRCPASGRLGRTLGKLSDHDRRTGDQRVRYRAMKVDVVLDWVAQTHVGDEDEIRKRLERKSNG